MSIKNISIQKLYFGLISFISLLVIAFSLTSILSSLLNYYFISDEEYISSKYYIFDQCKYDYRTGEKKEDTKYIAICVSNKTKQILNERKYNFKTSLIKSFTLFIVFSIIFSVHYMNFRKFINND